MDSTTSTTDSTPPVESSWVPPFANRIWHIIMGKAPQERANTVSRIRKREKESIIQEVFRYIYLSRSNFVSLFQSLRIRNSSEHHADTGEVPQRCAMMTSRIAALADKVKWQPPLVAPGHRYKNSHNFVISDQTCLKLFIRALSITIYFSRCMLSMACLCLLNPPRKLTGASINLPMVSS